MKPIVTWILVVDGAQAHVFENAGPGKGLAAVPEMTVGEAHLKAQDIMADRPGRSISSVGSGGRSAIEYSSDPVQVRETRFVKSVAEALERKLRDGAFDRLVVAAPPEALGDFRAATGEKLRGTILAELPKDLTHLPKPQLERHLGDVLAL